MGSARLSVVFSILSLGVIVALLPALYMRIAMSPYLNADITKVPYASAALVLGASVVHGMPSPILAERTEAANALYKTGKVGQILVTGAVEENYDEVSAMRQYLIAAGVPSRDIALDASGVDTFSSMYRARTVFLADSIVIVTQDFHLPRALYLARAMHIKAYGFAVSSAGSTYDYLREIPASWKALLDIVLHRMPETKDPIAPLVISGVALR